MEVADRIVVMNHGRIEQIGTPAEIYDHPATPFVMSFVGSVNVLPGGTLPLQGAAAERSGREAGSDDRPLFIRPHDLDVHIQPRSDTVPARLRRLSHMGRDLQAELVLQNDEVVIAQFPREQIDYTRIKPGDVLHVASRQARTFVPDYSI